MKNDKLIDWYYSHAQAIGKIQNKYSAVTYVLVLFWIASYFSTSSELTIPGLGLTFKKTYILLLLPILIGLYLSFFVNAFNLATGAFHRLGASAEQRGIVKEFKFEDIDLNPSLLDAFVRERPGPKSGFWRGFWLLLWPAMIFFTLLFLVCAMCFAIWTAIEEGQPGWLWIIWSIIYTITIALDLYAVCPFFKARITKLKRKAQNRL